MQVDIITKGAKILEVNNNQVIAFGNAGNEISFPIVIKTGDIQKMYTIHATVKTENGKQVIKTRME